MKKFLFNRKTIFAVALLSGIATSLYYALRTTYVFTDNAIFSGFSMMLLMLSAVNTLVLLLLYIMKANRSVKSDGKIYGLVYIISIIITAVLTIYDIVSFIVAGEETIPVFFRLLLSELPFLLAVFLIMFLVFAFPKLKNGAFKKALSAVIAVGVILSGVLRIFPCYTYKITCDPMVVDSGADYSVVFATNDEGTGYVTYEYDGKSYKVYDEDGGRIYGDSKIHTVSLPKEHLDGNTYKVGSVRVLDELSYGGRSGKEAVSKEYSFSAPSGEKQTYLTISDWHARLSKAYKSIENVKDYDGIIMLGDAVPGAMFEDEIVKYIVEFGGTLSKGEKPVIYVRGNHETRGPEASKLSGYLGLSSFYYTVGYGDYEFVVLDSGEDKEDSHPEYGGMVCYGDYRKNMVDWLETVEVGDKAIALSHSSDICFEEDLHARAYSELKKLGINQIVSGHTHTMDFFEQEGMNVYLDGNYSVATLLTLQKDCYTIEAYSIDGEKIFEKTLNW